MPPKWEKRQQFTAELKPPPGFEHVSRYADGEWSDQSSIWRYVPYTSYVGSDSGFDAAGFIEAFREATKALVAMEKDIDQILESLG